MKLVIAEKPSVAQSIARVIGAAGRKDGYVTPCKPFIYGRFRSVSLPKSCQNSLFQARGMLHPFEYLTFPITLEPSNPGTNASHTSFPNLTTYISEA